MTPLLFGLSLLSLQNQPVLPPLPAETIDMQDLPGFTSSSSKPKGAVVFFVTVECPIANRYSPEISRISKLCSTKNLSTYRVYVDPSTTRDEALRHGEEFRLSMPLVLDSKHKLVRGIGITATPECAVINARGVVVYRGRIDDTYIEHGRPRDKPTRLDLRIAIEEFLSGKRISVPVTAAVGCGIPPLPFDYEIFGRMSLIASVSQGNAN